MRLVAFNAARFGGTIYNQGDAEDGVFGRLTLTNVTITGNRNTGTVRGGLINIGEANLTFVTVAHNNGTPVPVSNSGVMTLAHSLLVNNGSSASSPNGGLQRHHPFPRR